MNATIRLAAGNSVNASLDTGHPGAFSLDPVNKMSGVADHSFAAPHEIQPPRPDPMVPNSNLPASQSVDRGIDDRVGSCKPELVRAVTTILRCLGEDITREGLQKTPERYAEALLGLTRGYENSAREVMKGAIFHEDCHGLIVVKDIEVRSLCEHHILPFMGKAHIGYMPQAGRILGLSKFSRLVDVFAERLQVQERLTTQVAAAIESELQPAGVVVVMECHHACMAMRGVQNKFSSTTTVCARGALVDKTVQSQFWKALA